MNAAGRKCFQAIVAGAVALPFLPLVLWSFSDRWFYPDLLPASWGLRAWDYIFHTAGPQIIPAIFQSMAISGAVAGISLVIGIPAGRALGMYTFRRKAMVVLMLTLPVIVPPLSVAMGLHLWFIVLGLTESPMGVVLVQLTFCTPYAILVMSGVFANYNPEYEDQARSLGASRVRVFFRVTLPFILPGAIVAALFSFLLSWSQYLSTLIIGGGKITTLPILLFALMATGDRPVAAGVSLIFVAPALLALVLSAKYMGTTNAAGVR